MGRIRRLVGGSAAAVVGYTAARLVARPRWPGAIDHELLGWARGSPRRIRGPRATSLYTEWFDAPSPSRPQGNPKVEREAAGTPLHGALVFTHGWCVTEAVWHYQKLAFEHGPHAVVTWDLPGHGHSSQVARGRLTLDIAVDALARVVDEVPQRHVVLVGHSLGGVLSLRYLARHPTTARERIRGVVVVSTPLMGQARWVQDRMPGREGRGRLVAHALQLAVQNRLVDRWFSREAGSHDVHSASYRLIRSGFAPQAPPGLVRFVRDMAASVPPTVRADTFRAMREFDLTPTLAEIGVPSVVAYGPFDRLVPPEESRLLASLLPRSRAQEFPGSGHAPFLEQEGAFNRLVASFAARRLSPPRDRDGRRDARSGPAVPIGVQR
jgi:pimeloyl-ACP methyl ester carboxylesterase